MKKHFSVAFVCASMLVAGLAVAQRNLRPIKSVNVASNINKGAACIPGPGPTNLIVGDTTFSCPNAMRVDLSTLGTFFSASFRSLDGQGQAPRLSCSGPELIEVAQGGRVLADGEVNTLRVIPVNAITGAQLEMNQCILEDGVFFDVIAN